MHAYTANDCNQPCKSKSAAFALSKHKLSRIAYKSMIYQNTHAAPELSRHLQNKTAATPVKQVSHQ